MIPGTEKAEASSLSLTGCPRCGASLALHIDYLTCPTCNSQWQIRGGIPRFFEPAYYWGEVSPEKAASLLHDAEGSGWRRAVEKHFEGDESMLFSILQWQSRTSWLPLLGLDNQRTVALDVGSGYGAITHALAHAAREVYSVEAIRQRIEFTAIRLKQENLQNVKLIQGSANKLPLVDDAFNLIVVNGVLEWVGEWDTEAAPREMQLRFLRKIHRMLKPGGILLLGIENRVGYNNFLGGLDHSGLAYTSLMPRWLASQVLQRSRRSHHRTHLNAGREYRTYTYSEFGYRKLLRQTGFDYATFYAADPGYNQPLSLVSLQRRGLIAHTLRMMSEPSLAARHRFFRLLKFYLSRLGLIRFFVPEFVIIAHKSGSADNTGEKRSGSASTPMRGIGGKNSVQYLSFASASTKAIIRVFDSRRSEPEVIVKASATGSESKLALVSEFNNLRLMQERLSARDGTLSVPTPIESFEEGGWYHAVETVAAGQPLSELIFLRSRRARFNLLRNDIYRCIEIATKIPHVLTQGLSIQQIAPLWYQIPAGLQEATHIKRMLAAESEKWALRQLCGHGDLTIENVFWESRSGKMSVIDWEHPMLGLPPLYDALTLLLSAVLALDLEHTHTSSFDEEVERQFAAAFFGTGRLAGVTREILQQMKKQLDTGSELWPQMLLCLVIRTNYFLWRQPSFGKQFCRLLQYALLNESHFVAGVPRPSNG